MGKEIERKFTVKDNSWRKYVLASHPYCQGYMSHKPIVRVRLNGTGAVITIKGPTKGISRDEFEYDIPIEDAKRMFRLCERPLIRKIRHIIKYRGLVWEVDEFLGDNKGLVVAEVELQNPRQKIDLPPWVKKDVSLDKRYHNSSLVKHPYRSW